jgi:hypothetical protein
MIAVRVHYTVRPEYTPTNQANIQAVIAELQALANPDIRYAAYLAAGWPDFSHVAMFATPEARGVLGQTDSFKKFQSELKASGLVSPPDAQPLEMVGASWEVF